MADLANLSADELKEFIRDKMPDLVQEEAPKSGKRKICVGVLAYQATGYWRTFMSLMQAVMGCAKEGWEFAYILREGDSMVARGRSFIASQFLENEETKDATDLVFVDCDLSWDGDEFVRLCKHPVDVVAGAYPYKDDTGRFPLRWSADGIREVDGLWNVDAVTPGFLRVTRTALERIASRKPWLEYKEHIAKAGQRTWMFFDNLQRPNGVWDEGFIFCEHWRSVGGQVWLDPDLKFHHIGPKAFYHGSIRQWVDKKASQFEKLEHEFPHVPPLELVNNVMTDKTEKLLEADDQHRNQGAAGAASGNGHADAAEHQPGGHDPADLSRRGRSEDSQRIVRLTERPAGHALYTSERRQPGGEVRPGLNGSGGGHLPARG